MMQVSAEYPDGSDRLVDARERRIPLIRNGVATGEEISVIEPVESDDWTFVFQVEPHMKYGGLFRAIPLSHANTFAYD